MKPPNTYCYQNQTIKLVAEKTRWEKRERSRWEARRFGQQSFGSKKFTKRGNNGPTNS